MNAAWWDAARRVCTDKELDTLLLQSKDLSLRQISLAQGLSLGTVRNRLFNAHRKIEAEIRKEAA